MLTYTIYLTGLKDPIVVKGVDVRVGEGVLSVSDGVAALPGRRGQRTVFAAPIDKVSRVESDADADAL